MGITKKNSEVKFLTVQYYSLLFCSVNANNLNNPNMGFMQNVIVELYSNPRVYNPQKCNKKKNGKI